MMYFILILLSFGIKIVCELNGVTARQFRNEKVDVYEYVYVTNNSSALCCTDHDIQKDEYYIHKDPLKKNEQETINSVNGILNHHSLLEDFRRKKREFIDKSYILKIENINRRSVTVKFFNIKESVVELNITCLSAWCVKPLRTERRALNVTENLSMLLEIDNLQPFAQYNIAFKTCHDQENCAENVITKQFTTKPTVPNSVTQLEVYSKDENSISLRWKPPYPPTGKLARYKISYGIPSQGQIAELSKGFPTQSCHLWPELHCYTLSDLKSENEYSIQLLAKNKDPEEYGQSSDISVITKKEPSDAPYDLRVEWTVESNLILKWKHPNISNGSIRRFNIILSPIGYETKTIYKVLNISKPILQYSYIIDSKELLPSVNYNISIRAYNGFNGNILIGNNTSPPNVSLLEYDPKPEIIGKTIVLELSSKMLKQEKLQNYKLFVLISKDKTKKSSNILNTSESFRENLTCTSEEHLRLLKFVPLYNCTFKDSTKFKFNIGKNDEIVSCDKISNYFVDPNKESYNITVILTNTYEGITYCRVYSWSVSNNKGTQSAIVVSSVVVVVLLIIIIGFFIYWKQFGLKCYFPSTHLHLQHTISKTAEAEETGLMQYTCQDSSHYSNRVTLSEFEQYVKESIMNGTLERQYDLISGERGKPCDYGAIEVNKPKNRYVNLIAYDHSRVVLQKIDEKEYSDYINANYIDGYKTSKAYIATQAPTQSTIFDFWRMIWQENVRNIFMLAKVNEGKKHKVIQYWPDVNSSMSFGNITVDFVSSKTHADYEQTIFRMISNGQLRIVEHFLFMSWPDHGVPLYPQTLVPLLEELHHLPLSSDSPIVVHCNAGVGRTGTILLCDICLRMGNRENAIDIVENLQRLREQRPNMVSNVQQYKLVHLVILEYLFGKKTGIPCANIEAKVKDLINDGRVKLQFEYLEEITWKDDAMKSVASTNQNFVGMEEKSRFPGIVPEIQGTIFLTPFPVDDPTSSFINAVTVDGFKNPNKFIVTQQPLPNTVGDFWRLVHQREVLVVLSLNNIDLDDSRSCMFWPTGDKPLLQPVDYLILKHLETSSSKSYDKVTIQLSAKDEEEERLIEILSIRTWSPGVSLPNNKKEFLTFLEQARILSKKSKQIVVTCYDGATASGFYVAMDFVIEMMNFGQMCDVCQAVRTVRHNRKQFIKNEEQLAFLYEVAVDFRDMSQLYANFN